MSVADAPIGNSFIAPKDVCTNFAAASRLEWLEANHTGAFAMGTIAGVNTRRYHGLLIASRNPPVDRISVLPRVEETVTVGDKQYELATVQYPGAVQPCGHRLLEEFRIDPFPSWLFTLNGMTLRKTVCLLDKQQAVLVSYRASRACRLSVRLMLSMRDYHSLVSKNEAVSANSGFSRGLCWFQPYPDLPPLTFRHSGSAFAPDAKWFFNNEYLRELERGLDYREDLYSPGSILFDLQPDVPVWFIASIDENQNDAVDLDAILAAESQRRFFRRRTIRALDQFRIVRKDGKPSLIAGYPWFTDWSRDTLISLPALLRSGFPPAECKAILTFLSDARRNGLLPNRFTDRQGDAEYNTVDASLWFFATAYDFVQQTGDLAFLRKTLYPASSDIIGCHLRGTDFGIHVDPSDQLLSSGAPGFQLTWMDAKVGDHVITPRSGKAVEINALWYNALRIQASWAGTLGYSKDAEKFSSLADQTSASFRHKFWNDEAACLFDLVDAGGSDASIRPNQLFAASLPFVLLDRTEAQQMVTVVRDKLSTPVGLRTLAPEDRAYRPRFEGGMAERDSAYHQGTVWPWLIGPFVAAYLYAYGRNSFSLGFCDQLLKQIENQFGACCLGSLSEVYDAESPQRPGGCPAQLWSVAQVVMARWLVDGVA